MWSDIGSGGQGVELTFIEQARRKQIVEATIEVLAEVGYGRTSLAAIAKRAGISKGVISYHFKGKDNLIAQVKAETEQGMEAFIGPRIEAETTARGKLHAFIRSYLEYVRDHRSHIIALIEIDYLHAREGGRMPSYESFGLEDVYQNVAVLLDYGQRTGEFVPFDTRVMAVALWGALEGVSLQWVADPELDLNHHIEEVIAMFDRAILSEEGRDTPPEL